MGDNSSTKPQDKLKDELTELNLHMKRPTLYKTYHGGGNEMQQNARFHGDDLIGDPRRAHGFLASWANSIDDFKRILTFKNLPAIGKVASGFAAGKGLDIKAGAGLIASMSNDSDRREAFIASQVKAKYERMLHPPLTYLGGAFQYRTADGKFNSVLNPHLGQAGAPYAKTVPSKTKPLGALPDAGDLFDRLMAREEGGRVSQSGLSSMLIYHATIIIHDIFRTNENDKNISDSSSYLDLSPLYGYTMEMQRKIRDDKYKLGLLKPDAFAEDRLLRQPPGVCIMLVMYNRYHNYAATQLRRINENNRFSVPKKFTGTKLESVARMIAPRHKDADFEKACYEYRKAWDDWMAKNEPANDSQLQDCEAKLEAYIAMGNISSKDREAFEAAYDAAWNKLDDDLFNTARLITCGLYIQISIHDYLRALMGFHQFDTNFTLEPRKEIDHKNVSRGLGNQVTVEFNLLYRFHCAISLKDEQYTEQFIREQYFGGNLAADPKAISVEAFMAIAKKDAEKAKEANDNEHQKPSQRDVKSKDRKDNKEAEVKNNSVKHEEVWERTFGLPQRGKKEAKPGVELTPEEKQHNALRFGRDPHTNLFDDDQMLNALTAAMDDPISNFGPRNVPKCLKPVEVLGIYQARKWEVGTLNDFRDFFGMKRHNTFESISQNVEIQNALRDLYEHPDKVELYPGIFCESDENMGDDPGPSDVNSALWAAIFSDAITLVRSDRFYTIDWNTNSLTSWGMKEVTPDNENLKSSVFHRLIQRAFPGRFPYNSIRFFHPFYTSKQNEIYAKEQGYTSEFQETKLDFTLQNTQLPIAHGPDKPKKPLYLDDFDKIKLVLKDYSGALVHPVLCDLNNFPPAVQKVFKAWDDRKSPPTKAKDLTPKDDDPALVNYFTSLMRDIVKRESVTMNSSTYQIDVTRDFAIPVITRYVADFLGFGHLIRTAKTPTAPYSENEIYQHITNCHVFLAYNADETKNLKRRKAFRSSFIFLYELTRNGNVYEANRWNITQSLFGRRRENAMTELGFKIVDRVLDELQDPDSVAAILLLAGLNAAYNSVLTFTSVLNKFITELYDRANHKVSSKPRWLELQELALSGTKGSFSKIKDIVLDAQRTSTRLPLLRRARKQRDLCDDKGNVIISIAKGDTIICDINAAYGKKIGDSLAHEEQKPLPHEEDYLGFQYGFTDEYVHFHPKHIAIMGFTAMIQTVAQMRNLQRGHATQGQLKKVRLDVSNENYSNYMAPMRIENIAQEKRQRLGENFSLRKFKFNTDTYMTPEWDEMIPFPTTWKLRFNGFGKSDYGKDFAELRTQNLPDDAPPFYQPHGASWVGGTFADVACVCSTPGKVCLCKDPSATKDQVEGLQSQILTPAELTAPLSKGCSLPG